MLKAVRARRTVHAGTGELVDMVTVGEKKKKQNRTRCFFLFITDAKQD